MYYITIQNFLYCYRKKNLPLTFLPKAKLMYIFPLNTYTNNSHRILAKATKQNTIEPVELSFLES